MPGEVYALSCAFLWAVSSVLIKSQADRMDIVSIGALRTVPAVLIYWITLVALNQVPQLLSLSLQAWLSLVGSALIGLVIGDLLYFASLKTIGLSRGMPLSATYPFFTLAFAAVLLGEPIGWMVVVGAVLISVGAYLLAFPRASVTESVPKVSTRGVAMAVGAAVCWGASTVVVRIGLQDAPVVVANAIRLPVLLLSLVTIALRQGTTSQIRHYRPKSLGIVFATGIIGMGLGTFTFLEAVQRVGAARTSVLTATTPLFGLPFALLMGERPSVRTLTGMALVILGVWLTISAG